MYDGKEMQSQVAQQRLRELGEKMNHKFKPGDKVRCVKEGNGVYQGMVYEVEAFDLSAASVRLRNIGWRYDDRFELVEEKSAKGDDLNTLIQRANDGMRAITALYNADPTVVAIHDDGDTRGVTVGYYSYSNFKEFRRKAPAPLPAPFTLKDSGHRVEFDFYDTSNNVKVGCQTFAVVELRDSLVALIRNNLPTSLGRPHLSATKNGIQHNGNVVTWADAEQLLAALERVKP